MFARGGKGVPARGVILASLAALLACITLMLASAAPALAGESEISSWDDLTGRRVGLITGAPFEELVREKNPDIAEVAYFNSTPDMLLALRTGKIDGAVVNLAVGTLAANRNDDLELFAEPLSVSEIGLAFPKGSVLCAEFSRVLEGYLADGTADELWVKWTGSDESAKVLPEQDWPGAAGTYRVAACATLEPCSYLGEQGIMGFDADIMLRAAEELDVHLEFIPMEFSEILASIEAGKADIGCGSIFITEERAQAMDFAVEYNNNLMLITRAAGAAAGEGSFIDGIVSSFRKTFITENRWSLILSGLGVTLLVACASGVLGLGLGFLSVLARRRGGATAGRILDGFQGTMGRLPIVVVLMVFYYIVFGRIDLPGVVVAIVVFTLAFGAASGATMWNCVSAVGRGQEEASLALGFDDSETFMNVILPQAARQFVPLLQAQLVNLVKDTAIVGYISVIDLTRASDLIRSRTMEAFFPLLTTALIYAAICSLVMAVMRAIMRRLDINLRERSIEGVEL